MADASALGGDEAKAYKAAKGENIFGDADLVNSKGEKTVSKY